MIFVTVGTHEQPFDRLIKYVDELKASGRITDDIFIQTGFSDYEPTSCSWKKLLGADEMEGLIDKAHIIITHGGPSSFLAPLNKGKVPIVVPRMKQFGEHVNNHQVKFTRAVSEWRNNIILIEEIDQLENAIKNYDDIVAKMNIVLYSNTENFTNELEMIVDDLLKEK